MDRKHEKYDRLLPQRAKELEPLPTSVAHPCDESSLTRRRGDAANGFDGAAARRSGSQD